jgi:DNA-binding NtrC family response regulator
MEDVPVLVRHLVTKYAAETKKVVRGVSAETLVRLQAHAWPGNVRELANVIERAVVLCAGDRIGPDDLALPTRAVPSAPPMNSGACDGDFYAQVKAAKQTIIRAALDQVGGNQTKAAEVLGLQRTHLVKLLRALEIRELESTAR